MSDEKDAAQTGDLSSLPQWARDAISRANNEAAERRVALRQKTDEHTAALAQVQSIADEKAAAEKAANDSKAELLKLSIALDAGVPGERVRSIAARLQGSTEDELKADAAALVNEFGINAAPVTRATDPSQGRGNDSPPAPNTPQAEFAQLFSELDIFKR